MQCLNVKGWIVARPGPINTNERNMAMVVFLSFKRSSPGWHLVGRRSGSAGRPSVGWACPPRPPCPPSRPAKPSTLQHSTLKHSTLQHSTLQRSTVQYRLHRWLSSRNWFPEVRRKTLRNVLFLDWFLKFQLEGWKCIPENSKLYIKAIKYYLISVETSTIDFTLNFCYKK